MSLTTGRGPLSARPAGRFNRPMPVGVAYVEPFRRRVRGLVGERTAVDSEQALLVHEPGAPPRWSFPVADVDVDGLPGTEPERELPGYVQVPWTAVDAWFEEDEPVRFHPRNPYHRVDCVRTSRRLLVSVGGVVVVDTAETLGVYETALEPRLYVRPGLVRRDLLVPSSTTTYCPYKGTASYWSVVADGEVVVADAAWSYEDPLPESLPLGGLLSFDDARVTVTAELPPAAPL